MISPKRHTMVSLFVGCGGLDNGFIEAGFEPIWSNEMDADASKSYNLLNKKEVIVDDIWNVIDSIPKADIIVGGPPCQSFSLVGKRLENDPRGKLVDAFRQSVESTLPTAFVMENVPGVMASFIDGVRLPLYLAARFEKLGYNVKIIKLLASDYFVPQKRQRVFLIGTKKELGHFEMINPSSFAYILGESKLSLPVTIAEALDDLPSPLPKGSKENAIYLKEPHSAFSRIMRNANIESVSLHSMPTMSLLDREFVKFIPPGGNYTSIPDEISTKRIMSFKKSGGRTTTYGRLHPDKPAYTINTFFNRPNVGANYHHLDERLITVREALRIQSFPDHFTPFYSNQRSLHMQVGNAVPPMMARAVAESLKSLLL